MKNFAKIPGVILFAFIVMSIGSELYGQNVAITDDDAYNAHSSAMLDVKSTTKGLLLPRLTTIQRLAISSPATGLIVYDTDFDRFFYYTGVWVDNFAEGLWKKSGSYISLGTSTDYLGLGTTSPTHKLHVRHTVTNTTGTDGNFIDIQNYSNNSGVMSGIRFQNGSSSNDFKGGIFYHDRLTYGRGDIVFANNPVASYTNLTLGDARMVIKSEGNVEILGNPNAAVDDPLFEVKNKDGQIVFGVYNEGVRINVDDSGSKGSKGGFAVGGFSANKGPTNNYLWITPDSVRIYVDEDSQTKGSKGGFAVGGFSSSAPNKGAPVSLFHLTKDNYFIGHESGINNDLGLYNSFLGFQAGKDNVDGSRNVFIGYQAGTSNLNSLSNVYIGHKAGNNSSSGDYNVYIGDGAGELNSGGNYNTFVGYRAGESTGASSWNTAIGFEAGMSLNDWQGGVYLGQAAGKYNEGRGNTIMGANAGEFATTGQFNVIIGSQAGSRTPHDGLYNTGSFNVFIGRSAGTFSDDGSSNVYIGYSAGQNATGSGNIYIGPGAGGSSSLSNKLIIKANSYELIKGDFSAQNINLNGSVGIGHTSTPTGKLDVRGGGVRIWDGSATVNYATGVGDLYVEDVLEVDDDIFVTDYIAASGGIHVGGTSDPGTDNLLVDGTANIITNRASSFAVKIHNLGGYTSRYGMQLRAGSGDGSGTNYLIECRTGNNGYEGGLLLVDNILGIYQNSDIRLKSDIIDSKVDALDIVNKLRVVDFSFTQTKDIRHTGYIAQEAREVFPDMVAYHEESDTWAVATAQLIPVLNRAIQQQQTQIESLEQKVTEQEQLVQLLISRIERLEDVKRSTQTPEPNIK